MTTTPRSFLASHRDDASRLVQRAKKRVPPPDQLAFYGGLGVLAALNVVNWPVALAIGVGAAVVARRVNARPPAEPGEATPHVPETQAAPAAKHQPEKSAPQNAKPQAAGQGAKSSSA
jgi:cation-transporting P-type ATPase I